MPRLMRQLLPCQVFGCTAAAQKPHYVEVNTEHVRFSLQIVLVGRAKKSGVTAAAQMPHCVGVGVSFKRQQKAPTLRQLVLVN